MDSREPESHTRAVYITQGTSRMRIAMGKKDAETEHRNMSMKGKSHKQGITIMVPGGRDSYCHRSD